MSGNGNGNGEDKVGAAIAAAEAPVQLRQWAANLSSTGRQAAILLPPDATDSEIAEFCGWVLGPVMATYREERKNPRSGIILPRPGIAVRA